MSDQRLHVYLNRELAGFLSEPSPRTFSFAYEPDYKGPSLSACMLKHTQVHEGTHVKNWFLGLIPESPKALLSIEKLYGVRRHDLMGVLNAIGMDCQGAVQVSENALEKHAPLVKADLLSDEQIAKRLLMSLEDHNQWLERQERWSLGGFQGKIALQRVSSGWAACIGDTASTHILKPGIAHMDDLSLNEHFCMTLAREAGIMAAETDYVEFDGVPALVVSRYDRIINGPNNVTRLHQEDFCQALGVDPRSKYTSDGGPNVAQCLALLEGTAGDQGVYRFTEALIFNYLVCGTDAHAKNYSLLHGADGSISFAPLYDVASYIPYRSNERRTVRMAMSIGGENRYGRLGKTAIKKFAEHNDFDVEMTAVLMLDVAARVYEASHIIQDRFCNTYPEKERLFNKLAGTTRHCCKTLQTSLSPLLVTPGKNNPTLEQTLEQMRGAEEQEPIPSASRDMQQER